MPRGTVHDDGGDQLHGRGIGTICVTHYSDDETDLVPAEFAVFLPFRNQNPRVEINDIVTFKVRTARCKPLGGEIRVAFNINRETDKDPADPGHPSRSARSKLEGLDR